MLYLLMIFLVSVGSSSCRRKIIILQSFLNLKHWLRNILAGELKLLGVIMVESMCQMSSKTYVQHKAFDGT